MQNLLGTKQGLAKPCRPTINNAPYQHYLSILPLLYAGLSPALSGQPVTHHAMIRIGNGEAASRERERASEDKKQSKQSKGRRRRPGSGPRPATPTAAERRGISRATVHWHVGWLPLGAVWFVLPVLTRNADVYSYVRAIKSVVSLPAV